MDMDRAGRRVAPSVRGVAWVRASGIRKKGGTCPGFGRREIDPAVAQDLRREKEEAAGFLLQKRGATGEDAA